MVNSYALSHRLCFPSAFFLAQTGRRKALDGSKYNRLAHIIILIVTRYHIPKKRESIPLYKNCTSGVYSPP